ncbi:MAG: hypothetical protein ACXWYO_00100, partial [Gaiellaceae bacterium]
MRAAYRPDGRGAADVLRQLAEVAADLPVPEELGAGTWADLLFEAGGLRDETEASQSLLLALARLHAGLVAHFDELPAEARDWYLQERLGIRRLRPVADRVVLVVTGDPRRLPVTLPKGAVVKAGKGPRGDRLYETTEALTVLGAQVLGAHGERLLPDRDVAASRPDKTASAPETPYAPFGAEDDPAAAHELYVVSEDLRAAPGGLARIDFVGARFASSTLSTDDLVGFFEALVWEASTPSGYVSAATDARPFGDAIRAAVTLPPLTGPLLLAGAERTHVRARFPSGTVAGFSRELAFGLRFDRVALEVDINGLVPDAAFANEGVLDLSKEFQPFGPAPRRNDAFYVTSAEAFGKRLTHLSVELHGATETYLSESPFTVRAPPPPPPREGSESGPPSGTAYVNTVFVTWERRRAHDWAQVAQEARLVGMSLDGPSGAGPFAEEVEVGKVRGRFLRARLDAGDFGWDRYEAQLLHNATELMKKAADPTYTVGTIVAVTKPEAPALTAVLLNYTTRRVATDDPDGPRV